MRIGRIVSCFLPSFILSVRFLCDYEKSRQPLIYYGMSSSVSGTAEIGVARIPVF